MSKKKTPQIFDEFGQNWESVKCFLPDNIHFHSHFPINYNQHVLMGRHFIMKTWKSINVFISWTDGTFQTTYSTRSIYSPSQTQVLIKARNSVYLVNKQRSSQPDKHYRIDFHKNKQLSLNHWHVSKPLLSTLASDPSCVSLNNSSLFQKGLPSLFCSFSMTEYFKIKSLLQTPKFDTIRMISSQKDKKSLEIGLPHMAVKMNPNIDDLFNFSDPTMITLSNGLVFISGGHQKSSYKAVNNCCILKVSSQFDRNVTHLMSTKPKEVPSMLILSTDNVATVENLTNPSEAPKWMKFSQIVDFLLSKETPVVRCFLTKDELEEYSRNAVPEI